MCCLKYKGKEVEGRELKLHRLTAEKKLRKVRWSPLSETGQKSDSMFATIIRTALFKTILLTLFRREFVQYPDDFNNWGGGVYLYRVHNKITSQSSSKEDGCRKPRLGVRMDLFASWLG